MRLGLLLGKKIASVDESNEWYAGGVKSHPVDRSEALSPLFFLRLIRSCPKLGRAPFLAELWTIAFHYA